jgi:hypothetical protein
LGGKILSMSSFGREVKPFAPFRRFAACQRTLNGVEKGVISAKLRTTFSPTVPPFATRSTRVDGEVEKSCGESGKV